MGNTIENIENITASQVSKLQHLLHYLKDNSTFYQGIFSENNIDISTITSLHDLEQIPFTCKDDLAKYNDDFLCVDKKQVADFVTTSGTLSDPVTFYLTAKDIDRLAENEAQALRCAGGSSDDIYQLMTTIDKRFMAGLAYQAGILKMGAGIVRTGPGAPFLQWESIQRFSPTVLIAIPSFIPKLIDYAIENGIDYKNTSIKSIVCIGEPIRNEDFSPNELGKRILSLWDVQLASTYASTEMGAAFTECTEGTGGHLNPDLLILEVVDEKGNAVKNGGIGEVIVTTLGVEGMPLLRYKTGDLCHVYYDECNCGKNTTRLGPVMGRKQQMIKFKGTTIFPPAIFDVLDMLPEIGLYQVEISKNEYGNDHITVLLPNTLDNREFHKKVKTLFKSKLRVTPDLRYIDTEHLNKQIFKQEKRKPEKLVYV
ncbi:MAG: phenylacetate--CoA ligase [Flavobacteriales bacterium]|nr:MAG: phenylacetate--CoA ligase [Flavobacteriales bacterium]